MRAGATRIWNSCRNCKKPAGAAGIVNANGGAGIKDGAANFRACWLAGL